MITYQIKEKQEIVSFVQGILALAFGTLLAIRLGILSALFCCRISTTLGLPILIHCSLVIHIRILLIVCYLLLICYAICNTHLSFGFLYHSNRLFVSLTSCLMSFFTPHQMAYKLYSDFSSQVNKLVLARFKLLPSSQRRHER